MAKRNDTKKPAERRGRKQLVIGVIIEIVVMAIGVVCVLLPMPWRLVVPIIIGAREIILKARRYVNSPQEPKVVHCCGVNSTNTEKERKVEKAKQNNSKRAGGKVGSK